MTRKLISLSAVAIIAATAFAGNASAAHRMISKDFTKGGKVVDNGVNDGRFCAIFNKPVFDKWTETWKMVKTKQCSKI